MEDMVAMRVLVTGHAGYIGVRLVNRLLAAGHAVVGLDSHLFSDANLGDPPPPIPELHQDIRDTKASDLQGFDAMIHLAGLSNDPLGEIEPALTDEINNLAAVRIARLASEAGIRRFVFASTCSVYGAASGTISTETSPCHPVTAYARAKLTAEAGVLAIARDHFEPVALRCATAYGFSSRIRMDLAVNNLTAWAMATRRVRLKSDGSAWRPLLHVDDAARAFLAALDAPASIAAGRVFNVCAPAGNHTIVEVARRVESLVPGAAVEFSGETGPDPRNYRVDGSLFLSSVPGFQPEGTLDIGIKGLVDAFTRWPMAVAEFEGPLFRRVDHLLAGRASGKVDAAFRPVRGLTPA